MEGVTRYGIGVYSFPIEDKENFWIHIRIKPYKPIPDLNYYRFVLNHSGTIMYWGERPMMFQVNTGIDEKAYMFFHNGPIFSNTGNCRITSYNVCYTKLLRLPFRVIKEIYK